MGRKGQPHYRILVAEHARAVQGKFIEAVGTYKPTSKEFEALKDRIEYWISVGAQPSQTVARLLKKNGYADMDKFIKFVHFKKKEAEKSE